MDGHRDQMIFANATPSMLPAPAPTKLFVQSVINSICHCAVVDAGSSLTRNSPHMPPRLPKAA
jgi:hypothetical protein